MRLILGLCALAAGMGVATAMAETQPPKPGAVKSVKVRTQDPVTSGRRTPPPAAIPYTPDGALLSWYSERGNVRMPAGDKLTYCHGYGCLYRQTVLFDDGDIKELKAIFASRTSSAEQERDGINLAVSWWEKKAAAAIGAPPDVRGSDFAHAGKPGQTDCLDEATNSTTMLVYLQQQGFLRYHHVERPESRGGILASVVHATAVIKEEAGEEWVVDSWMRDSGDPNDVMPLEEWSSKLW